jgi:anti-sigma factor RsiW
MIWILPRRHLRRTELVDWAESGLTPRQQRRAERHLAGCARCRGLAEALQETAPLLRKARGPEPDPAVAERIARQVQARIAQEVQPAEQRRPSIWPILVPAAAGASLALIILLLTSPAGRGPESEALQAQRGAPVEQPRKLAESPPWPIERPALEEAEELENFQAELVALALGQSPDQDEAVLGYYLGAGGEPEEQLIEDLPADVRQRVIDELIGA